MCSSIPAVATGRECSRSRQADLDEVVAPVPSVPRCTTVFDFSIAGCFAVMRSKRASRPAQTAPTGFGGSCHAPLSRPWLTVRPCGTARSITARSGARLSGRSLALRLVNRVFLFLVRLCLFVVPNLRPARG